MTTLEHALPQLAREIQRQVARHLADHPGFATLDRLAGELIPRDWNGAQRGERRRQIAAALRRLQAIGFVRYDSTYGGWQR